MDNTNYHEMKVVELKEVAKRLIIKGYYKMHKAKAIAAAERKIEKELDVEELYEPESDDEEELDVEELVVEYHNVEELYEPEYHDVEELGAEELDYEELGAEELYAEPESDDEEEQDEE